MFNPSWSIDLGQFGMFILAVLAFIGVRVLRKPKKAAFSRTAAGNGKIHKAVVELDSFLGDVCYNVSLTLNSNGGDNPKTGHPLFNVVIDASDTDVIEQFGDWFNRPRVDSIFYELWENMEKSGNEFSKTRCENFKHHKYRSFLLGNGCKMTYMFLVGNDNINKESYVVYINLKVEDLISDMALNEIRRTVVKIRRAITEDGKTTLTY